MTTSTPEQANPTAITMYGAEWCSDCRRSKKFLDASGVDYVYVDLEVDVPAADIAKAISGRTNIPVVVFPDGDFFVEPTDADLAAKLEAAAA
ncbi:glutaredoxin family protein [Agromyces seonyuensis]|uniref:NrdH-redoxin n=1 Tax=Agromyces seonyuensis TaxID=2662446 RepID=A0A6I4NZX5_9MICO|nr:glutaredoxin family protein [Agromyces seonyuensis]MWB99681.1 NrdH-redoxin [Agromyces seonyuensis]